MSRWSWTSYRGTSSEIHWTVVLQNSSIPMQLTIDFWRGFWSHVYSWLLLQHLCIAKRILYWKEKVQYPVYDKGVDRYWEKYSDVHASLVSFSATMNDETACWKSSRCRINRFNSKKYARDVKRNKSLPKLSVVKHGSALKSELREEFCSRHMHHARHHRGRDSKSDSKQWIELYDISRRCWDYDFLYLLYVNDRSKKTFD